MNSTENILQQISELREKLNFPKKNRPSTWEEDVAKLIGLIANDLSSQKDHTIALREASLITLAATYGNKNAKKRVVKPSLWLSERPPSIHESLEHQDEKCAAIKLLSTIRSEWIISYLIDELIISPENSVRASLLDWLIKSTKSVSSFMECINSINKKPKEISEEVWVLEILDYVTHQISKKNSSVNQEFFSGISKFLSKHLCAIEKLDHVQAKTLELINQVSYLKPSAIYSSQIAYLLSMFESNRSTKNKKVTDLVKKIEENIIDINDSIVLAKKSDLHVITRSLHASLQKISTQYKDALLPPEDKENDQQKTNDHETENIIVSFISNWDEYILSEKNTPAIEQLTAKFNLLLDKFSIAKFSSSGAIESYDPIKHELINDSNPVDIQVIKSGYGKIRPDGSIRILIKAIVQ